MDHCTTNKFFWIRNSQHVTKLMTRTQFLVSQMLSRHQAWTKTNFLALVYSRQDQAITRQFTQVRTDQPQCNYLDGTRLMKIEKNCRRILRN